MEFSGDGKFVLSGSDDTNLRVWKADASKPLKVLLPREKEAIYYAEKLKENYKFNKEIQRIKRHKHLPKWLLKRKKVN